MLYLIASKTVKDKQISKNKLSITSITGNGQSRRGIGRRLNPPFASQRVSKYYHQLLEMALLIIGFNPETHPLNPYQRIEKQVKLAEYLPREQLLPLYQLLVRASVLFNRTHRLRKKRQLITSREDVVNALALIRPVAFPTSMLLPTTRKFYRELLSTIGTEREITRQEVSGELHYHPQKVWRHLLSLKEAGYLKLTRRGARGISYYRIVQCGEE